jgi:hypothetical protein
VVPDVVVVDSMPNPMSADACALDSCPRMNTDTPALLDPPPLKVPSSSSLGGGAGGCGARERTIRLSLIALALLALNDGRAFLPIATPIPRHDAINNIALNDNNNTCVVPAFMLLCVCVCVCVCDLKVHLFWSRKRYT